MDDNNIISDELLAAFLDGDVNKDEANEVLSAIESDSELMEILSISEGVDLELENEERGIIPIMSLAAAHPQNLCSFECETFILHHLDFDIDNWSLLETAKANNWVKEEGTPLHHVGRLLELRGLHVERKYDSTIEDLENALNEGKQVIAVVDNNVLEQKKDNRVPLYHAIYVTDVKEDGTIVYLNLDTLLDVSIEKEVFLKAWKCSSKYIVTATEYVKEYKPQPINVEDIDLDADLEELTEAIAENAHDTWARARMDEGWTYGPVRNDELKQHPDLVPYSQLPDSEKEYDRLMAMNTLRLVRRLGFDIINRNNN